MPEPPHTHEAKQLLHEAMQRHASYDRIPALAVTDITMHENSRKLCDKAWLAKRYPPSARGIPTFIAAQTFPTYTGHRGHIHGERRNDHANAAWQRSG
jgi:hypothetical protein